MLILSRKTNESIIIGDNIEVMIVEIKGDQVKLGIKAPKEVSLYRGEIYLAIQEENKEAAKSNTSTADVANLIKTKKNQ